jgi:hypothetical protein
VVYLHVLKMRMEIYPDTGTRFCSTSVTFAVNKTSFESVLRTYIYIYSFGFIELYYLNSLNCGSRNSSVDIATCYRVDDRGVGFRVPVGARIFTSLSRPNGYWGPLSFLSMGTGGSKPVVKLPGCEADHSFPASAEVKKTWIYTFIPHTPSWRSAYLVK